MLFSRPSTTSGGSASFTVTWDAPETNADGSAASSILRHKLYWSQNVLDRENASRFTNVAFPTLTYTATGQTAGTWYVWVAAVSSAGESDVSPPLEVIAA